MQRAPLLSATDLDLYDRAATESASIVVRRYSTSFAWASRLMAPRVRTHVARIYALVRVADELVDGPAEAAGVGRAERRTLLDALERETMRAIERGYSTNLVVHAFAITAREHGFGAELAAPFFASMRADIEPVDFDETALAAYIHGSAEVVGLMCLAVFEDGRTRSDRDRALLEDGARRLGAAFQKINFLRDYADDRDELGRCYLPGVDRDLTDAVKAATVRDIRRDLACADAAIPLIAPSARAAVWAARTLFGELVDRVDRVPVSTLVRERVRVPDSVKARILIRALARRAAR
ncbi:phytoene/squalene synthase family protein [Microbacterium karelineae]|uniref:phytoene/squalene synthase family protein n=1 Tax=Microbacterium karelineae TaxID=2654283 RepID=UPI0018D47E04|nr:squalene/phytoene synthase family protein [Microbacterium karelineae]